MTTRVDKMIALIQEYTQRINSLYDEDFGDDKLCVCDHPYYRHFDTYDDMEAVGCKYSWQCKCSGFKLKENQDGTQVSVDTESLID